MKKKIIIIGGGIAGLSAGIYALKAGYDAEIYEKNAKTIISSVGLVYGQHCICPVKRQRLLPCAER